MNRRKYQAAVRQTKKAIQQTGLCDLCSKPWVFVTHANRVPIRRRCSEHRDTA